MDIKPYEKNAKKHPASQVNAIANSLMRFSWQQPIVVDKENTIIVGHGRWEAYSKYKDKIDEPWIVDNEGKTISGKQGKELTAEEIKAYRLADNKLNESDWDMELVIEELEDLDELVPLTGFSLNDLEKAEPYTTIVDTPIYETSSEKPEELELFDTTKYDELIEEINASSIPETEKNFLRISATRHIVFNYSKIANFYSHSSKEMQELMENSALVIIDFDKAIEKGFATLTKKIEEEYLNEHGYDSTGRG